MKESGDFHLQAKDEIKYVFFPPALPDDTALGAKGSVRAIFPSCTCGSPPPALVVYSLSLRFMFKMANDVLLL